MMLFPRVLCGRCSRLSRRIDLAGVHRAGRRRESFATGLRDKKHATAPPARTLSAPRGVQMAGFFQIVLFGLAI